jgi:hypothetical protein
MATNPTPRTGRVVLSDEVPSRGHSSAFLTSCPFFMSGQSHLQAAPTPRPVLRLTTLHRFKSAHSKSHSKCQWHKHWSLPFLLIWKGFKEP